jgi:hypothetical protein
MKIAALAAVLGVIASAAPLGAQAPDTSAVRVRGPVVVACYIPVPQERLDADEDLATVFDDFSYHWSQAVDTLERRGVAAQMRGARWVKLLSAGRLRLVRCPRPVGYVLAAPGRLPRVITGVETDSDLVDAAAAYFRWPERKERRDGGHR